MRHAMVHEELLSRRERRRAAQRWILLVGSYRPVRALLTQALGMMGYTVLDCATLSEAEPLLRNDNPPGLIFFDELEAGEEALAQRVRQFWALLPSTAWSSLMILSALHPATRQAALPGRVHVMVKPFNLAQVLHVVADLLQPAA